MTRDVPRVDWSARVADLFRMAGDAATSEARLTRPYRAAIGTEQDVPVILCGSGAWGRATARRLAEVGKAAAAFVDNAAGIQGSIVEGLEILSPAEASRRYGDRALYVVTIYNGRAVERQLAMLGCRRVLPAAAFYHGMRETFLPYYRLDDPRRTLDAHDAIVALANRFDDEVSRRVFVDLVATQIGLDRAGPEAVGDARDCYLEPALFQLGSDDIVIDCGAFDGDTVVRVFDTATNPPRSIVALEPDPGNAARLKATVAGLVPDLSRRVTVIEAATSRTTGRVAFDAAGTVAARTGSGTMTVATVALDDLEGEAPTYVKMDIEGHELEALHGLARTMQVRAPILAISLYHRADDLWRIPAFIARTQPSYRLHLRSYAEGGWETVCYAVPPARSRLPA